jgi:hypothetical protein
MRIEDTNQTVRVSVPNGDAVISAPYNCTKERKVERKKVSGRAT